MLCSDSIDDLTQTAPWPFVEDEMQRAKEDGSVVLLHAHTPGVTISRDGIDRVLSMADAYHLDYMTYRDLDPASHTPPHAGLALAFDDNGIDEWYGARDLLAAHHARVTYFVTRYYSRSDSERAELRELIDAGNDIQPHSVDHLHVSDYVHANSIDDYVATELLPSLGVLTDAGYPPATIYAYPFGERPAGTDAAVMQHVPRVRISPGQCPY